ncbi:MAG: hypothetical protein HND40_11135 [Ignavibacteriota bacterium]|nr:MAG: hypothetical protein HND40_11135 [Ignavibacteriota bacterium]
MITLNYTNRKDQFNLFNPCSNQRKLQGVTGSRKTNAVVLIGTRFLLYTKRFIEDNNAAILQWNNYYLTTSK